MLHIKIINTDTIVKYTVHIGQYLFISTFFPERLKITDASNHHDRNLKCRCFTTKPVGLFFQALVLYDRIVVNAAGSW